MQGSSFVYFSYARTLILRGASRRARLLLGVSMVITLSRPLSREPNIFAPRFFFPLSSVTAMSSDLDLERKHDLTNTDLLPAQPCSSLKSPLKHQLILSFTHLRSGLNGINSRFAHSFISAAFFLFCSLDVLSPKTHTVTKQSIFNCTSQTSYRN